MRVYTYFDVENVYVFEVEKQFWLIVKEMIKIDLTYK